MRRTFNRFSLAAFVVTLSLGAARIAFSDGPNDPWRSAPADPAPLAGQVEPTSGAPLILNLGPPPTVYSASADFGARVEAAPGWAVASDARTAWTAPAHPVVSTPPMLPSCLPQSGPFDTSMPLVATPCYECPPPMHTAMQPQPAYGAPSYYAPAPNPALMLPTMPVPAPTAYSFAVPAPSAPSPGQAYNPSVVYPSRLAATPAPVTHSIYFSSPAAGEADHLEHVMQAIHHLEAAGMQAQADQLRRECDSKVERLIECFKSNEAELSRLHQAASNFQSEKAKEDDHCSMVTAQLCMLDVDLKRLDALKLDSKNDAIAKFVKAFRSHPHGGFDSFEFDAAELRSAIDSLQKQGVVEVLSRPAIMTRSGEEACLQIGQSIPQPAFAATGEPCIQQRFVGTSASIKPEVVDQNTVRMLVKVSCNEPGDPISMHQLGSIVLAHCGEAVFLSGLRTADNGKTTAKLIVICPQIVKNDDLPPPLPVAANSGYSCGPAPCSEAVQPASVNFEAYPTSEASAGACKCGSSAACGGKCGDNCTCGSSAACTTKDATDVRSKSMIVHVELLELNRTKARSLGFDFANIVDGKFVSSGIGDVLAARLRSDQKSAFFGFLEALKKEGVVRVLSDPTLCTVSGRPVHFHCGGEIPILSKQSDSSPTIEYKKYGTQIDCVPILREDQSVRLEINTRLSQLDPSRDVTIGETRVPGLRVHEFDTAGEVKPGQALVVVGPVEHRVSAVCREVSEAIAVPPFIEQLAEQFADCFDDHPAVGMATSFALNSLRSTSSHPEVIQVEEEVQFIAVIRPEVAESNEAQPAFDAKAFGCDLGCCEPNAGPCQCQSHVLEALLPPPSSSFAVQPAACWAPPSNGNFLFDHVLIDTSLSPGAVQPALFTAPQSLGSKSLFDFDFQLPVLPPLDLATPANSPLR